MAVPVLSAWSEADRVQVRLLRSAGIAGRFARARSLTASVIGLSRRAIRKRHPTWPERDVELEFIRAHYGFELARRVRDRLERCAR